MCKEKIISWEISCKIEREFFRILLEIRTKGYLKNSFKKIAQEMFTCILAEKIQGNPFWILSKFLSGETLCKFYQIFPPKNLVYIWTNFSWHFCNYLIEIQLFNKNKIIVRKTLVLDSNDFIDKKNEDYTIKKWANNTEFDDFY